jgi:hypothetical protein
MDSMDTFDMPEAVATWLLIQIGKYEVIHTYRDKGARTGVWQISSGDGEYIVKLHNQPLRWHMEVMAYQQWAIAYDPYVSRLCAVYKDDRWQGILTTTMPGRPVSDCLFDGQDMHQAFVQAGRLCRRLADLAVGERFGLTAPDGTPVDYEGEANADALSDPVKYQRHSFLRIFEKVQRLQVLEPHERTLANWALDSMELFTGEKPILVNGDYTPGNWLCNDRGDLTAIIDLEQIVWDVEMAAFIRLEGSTFIEHPNYKAAFWEGYGAIIEDKRDQLRILRIMHALYRIGYGVEMGNARFLSRGRAELQRLYEE